MALSVVQCQTNAGTTGFTLVPTLTAGNAIIASVMLDGGTAPSFSTGDTLTARISFVDSGSGSGMNQYQFSNYSVAGGSTTFTLNWSGGGNGRLFIIEVSGMATASAFDQSATQTAASATSVSSGTTGTTTQADEICIAQFHLDASFVNTLSSLTNSFTVPGTGSPPTGDKVNFANTMPSAVATRIVAATGAYETTITLSDTGTLNGAIGTYKAAVSSDTLWAQSLF